VLTSDYLGVFVLLALGVVTGVGALGASYFLGARRQSPRKTSPYECGIPSEGAENQRFSVKFYLVAVSFILFDIEAVFLIPWALSYQDFVHSSHGLYAFVMGMIFLGVLTLGLVYEWRKGLLDWNK
jgi:NADH-quinone oxidoreductase subunit A